MLLFKMKNEERRQKLREALERIVETGEEVSSLMREVPHPRGVAYRSLKNRSGEHIVHMEDGFTSTYKSKHGKVYEIVITKR